MWCPIHVPNIDGEKEAEGLTYLFHLKGLPSISHLCVYYWPELRVTWLLPGRPKASFSWIAVCSLKMGIAPFEREGRNQLFRRQLVDSTTEIQRWSKKRCIFSPLHKGDSGGSILVKELSLKVRGYGEWTTGKWFAFLSTVQICCKVWCGLGIWWVKMESFWVLNKIGGTGIR